MRTAFHRNLVAQAAETQAVAANTLRVANQAKRLADLPGNALLLVLDAQRVIDEPSRQDPPTHGDLSKGFGQKAAKALALGPAEIDFLFEQIFPLRRQPDGQKPPVVEARRGQRRRSARRPSSG